MIGVLALQGNFQSHLNILEKINLESLLVKKSEDLNRVSGLIIPGGESTTMSKLLVNSNLDKKVKEFSKKNPILGTCAGAIIMSKNSSDKRVLNLGLLDMNIDRNAYGRQVFSFSDQIKIIDGENKSNCEVLFIRAPKIINVGNNCDVFAFRNDEVVGVKQGKHFAITCHPELMGNTKIHEMCFKKNR